jgi:hypothetical protein
MLQSSKTTAFLGAALLALGLSVPLAAAEKFIDSDDGKKDDEAPQTFLKDYDKLVKGKEADWVSFTEGFDAKAYKTVRIKEFSTSGKGSRLRNAAEDGAGYYEKHIQKAKLGWEVVSKGAADLTLEGNIANAWEPSGGAKFWGGWMANPGTCQEVIGRNSGGKIVFQIRQKSRGSTVSDAVENGIEKIVETLKKGK